MSLTLEPYLARPRTALAGQLSLKCSTRLLIYSLPMFKLSYRHISGALVVPLCLYTSLGHSFHILNHCSKLQHRGLAALHIKTYSLLLVLW